MRLHAARLRFRRPRNADIPRLVEIELRSFFAPQYHNHRLTAENFTEMMKQEKTFLLVAEYGQHIIGDLIGGLPADTSRLAHLNSIAVDSKWRGRGVGGCLAARLVAKARRAGHAGVSLEVAQSNLRGQRLFTALGFRRQRRLVGYYGRIDGIRMVLRFR